MDIGLLKEIIEAIIRLLVNSPPMLLTVAMACGSGHLWVYIIFSHFTKKEHAFLENIYGKTALGLIWFALIFIPVHLILNNTIIIDPDDMNINTYLLNIIVFGLASQAVIFIIYYYSGKKTRLLKKKVVSKRSA
jgi:threonine/homoserine efflux transporter RhtA